MRVITIMLANGVALSVNAYKDENGDVHIDSIRGYVGMPSIQEIYESLDSDAFDEMSLDFDKAKES